MTFPFNVKMLLFASGAVSCLKLPGECERRVGS